MIQILHRAVLGRDQTVSAVDVVEKDLFGGFLLADDRKVREVR
jgi:hypothetical protein